MTEICPFIFGETTFATGKVFYARLSGELYNKDQLLQALFYLLWFPGYFGFNWDALLDMLRDFHWIRERNVVLVHDSLPKISDAELKIYLEVLRDAVLDWRADENHRLEVVFRETDRVKIMSLLKE